MSRLSGMMLVGVVPVPFEVCWLTDESVPVGLRGGGERGERGEREEREVRRRGEGGEGGEREGRGRGEGGEREGRERGEEGGERGEGGEREGGERGERGGREGRGREEGREEGRVRYINVHVERRVVRYINTCTMCESTCTLLYTCSW